MRSQTCNQPTNADFPALSRLRLEPAQWAALRSQGFVSAEPRRGKHIYKLRFRCGGRQQVRYISSDAIDAQAVERELARLQADVRQRRRLSALTRAARQILRDGKRQLAQLLEPRGYHLHGRRIRKRRPPKQSV